MVVAQEEIASEELSVVRGVRRAIQGRADLHLIWDSTMYHRDDLPFASDLSDLPDVFTPARNKIESRSKVRPPVPGPRHGALQLPGGRGLEELLQHCPQTIEELNVLLPEGAPRLATPKPSEKVHHLFSYYIFVNQAVY